jgi:AraC family transcriptional regulator
VLDYIGENLCADLSLSQLAQVSGMSAHYFAEMFRQSTGCPPHQYVLMRRIDLAKERLRDPQRNILDVALDAGFQNHSHFARAFRKYVGVSPSTFRSVSA